MKLAVAFPILCTSLLLACLAAATVRAQEAQPQAPQAQAPQAQGEQAVSGRELLAGCEQGKVDGQPNQYCMRYVFGLVQTVVMVQQMDTSKAPLFCIDPKAVTLPQVTATVTDWLKENRQRLDEDAYVLVSEALHQHYPCSRT